LVDRVVIKASLTRPIDTLIADLASPRRHAIESAIARLAVIGGRAVARLVGLLDSTEASPARRVAALRALEAIADPRALDAALRAVDDPHAGVAEAAISVARLFLRGPRGVAVVDQLTRVALDGTRGEPVRVAAIRVLGDLERSTIQPLIKALEDESGAGLSSAARRTAFVSAGSAGDQKRRQREATEGALPDDPVAFRRTIAQGGHAVPLPVMHRLVERLRDREGWDPDDRRAEWMAARAAIHLALARRGSRLGLYDVRETLETATGPLPVEFLSALSAVGDATCLEPIAAAFARDGRIWPARRVVAPPSGLGLPGHRGA
jgi:HEAT repeat protein